MEAESGRGGSTIMHGALLVSDDGLIWRYRSLFQEISGNETAFLFEPDGTLLALSRQGADQSQLARARPPYVGWKRTKLPEYMGGPLLAEWGRAPCSGRPPHDARRAQNDAGLVGKRCARSLCGVAQRGGQFVSRFRDTGRRTRLVSWYSSHEKEEKGHPITAIYLAELMIEP